MKKKILIIKNARVIDPSQNMDDVSDILIENGCIKSIGKIDNNSRHAGQDLDIYDADGLWAVPGFIDMHVHLREPGFEHKETIYSGVCAAAVGGFTSICCMPNTQPVLDHGGTLALVHMRAKEANLSRVYPIGAATKGRAGTEMTEAYQLKKAGAVALSDDGSPIGDANLMRRIMEYAHAFNLIVINHCEDLNLSQEGVMVEGDASCGLGLKGVPSVSESVMVSRDVLISQFTGIPVHLAHISTKQ
ncbi:MAG: amidohydrolase family protein, partial [Chlamydiota bacterium]|nr:amidohydrolase family protein [Chlamydiota bacterium]